MAMTYRPIGTDSKELKKLLAKHSRIVLMESNEPVAVVLSVDDFRSMQATIALANDPEQLMHVLDRADAMSTLSETYADERVRES